MLELRPTCEHCNKPLPPHALDARICSYECTFCAACVEKVLANVCPNCGGGFVPRPPPPVPPQWGAGSPPRAPPAAAHGKGQYFPGRDPENKKIFAFPVGVPGGAAG